MDSLLFLLTVTNYGFAELIWELLLFLDQKKINDQWQEPELIVSQFAGEPTLDDAGNLYFVHHYFENNIMIEADIYVAFKKR
ncbi:MAG TPA: hypothetical protein P5538_03695 [Bacteroidales bacterium]|jgi:hypothetical protein|nr:hypothetical protein [Bacteroidales bacterium]HOL98631.1 hypothetical protein [Bacteroidales bacterium]HOM37015.1 hypothetical protein [Bacteroidales bacterium]HPD24099.1 hypothetical protein [Bacteroidales bacterium]HRS99327.1 hypothetical protein [Bacteroidales bacterium]